VNSYDGQINWGYSCSPGGVLRRLPVGVFVRVDIGDGLLSPLGIPPPILVDGPTENASLFTNSISTIAGF
jgi:hypothetical protein